MKNMILPAILFLSLTACNSEQNKQQDKDTTITAMNQTPAGNFDLSKVNFSEKIETALSSEGIKLADGKSQEQTMMGYQTFSSTSSKLLKFNGKDLSGESEMGKNQLILHYSDKDGQIGMYEVKIYSKAAGDELLTALNSLGKPSFEKAGLSDGAVEIDENGNEVKASAQSQKSYKVWENTQSGLAYFLIQTGSGSSLYYELTSLNMKSKASKDWISFRAFDWYKK